MARRGFEVMKEAIKEIAPGLRNIVLEIGAEPSWLGRKGAFETALTLFNGAALTRCGTVQHTPTTAISALDKNSNRADGFASDSRRKKTPSRPNKPRTTMRRPNTSEQRSL